MLTIVIIFSIGELLYNNIIIISRVSMRDQLPWSALNLIGSLLLNIYLSIIVMSVRGQGLVVLCRASFNCAGGPGDDLGVVVDGEACCLGNPDAQAYSPQGSEDCFTCVGEFIECQNDIPVL